MSLCMYIMKLVLGVDDLGVLWDREREWCGMGLLSHKAALPVQSMSCA